MTVYIISFKVILEFKQMELNLTRKEKLGSAGSHDMIKLEGSYCFSTTGQYVFAFCRCWNKIPHLKKINHKPAICCCNS